ncbi:MAG: MFS transporter [Planctomycetota bacterium]
MQSSFECAPLDSGLRTRLSIMMFLQYAIWGAWLPFLWSFLSDYRGMNGDEIGYMFAAGAVGAIVGPFLAGQMADRWFATEKMLALSHLIGAALVWQLANVETFNGFLIISLFFGMVYAPTLPLTNALAFHHLPSVERDFGKVRLWGTFGWIAVGIGMGHWLGIMHSPADLFGEELRLAQVAGKADAFRLSAVLGALMGLYCWSLPHTPPSKSGDKNATLEALAEIKKPPLLLIFLLAVPVSCIHQFYFVHTESFLHARLEAPDFFKSIFGVGGGGFMTIGQMTEVLVIGLIPWLMKRFSKRSILGLGLVAYALRMALFAYCSDSSTALLFGVALHGVCFGCFIFVCFMIVDEYTTADVRASAQNLYNLVIVGIGVIVGSKIAGWVSDWADGDYRKLFSVPMWASLGCLLILVVAYPRPSLASENS